MMHSAPCEMLCGDRLCGVCEMDTFVVWVTLAMLWLTGETGRVFVASGAGGLVRWLGQEKRKMRDGVIAVIGGSIAGHFLWPFVLAIIGVATGPLPETPSNIAMAAFVAGTSGMSLVKIVTAFIEKRAQNLGNGGGNDAP